MARVDVGADGVARFVAGGGKGSWLSLSGMTYATTGLKPLSLGSYWKNYGGSYANAEYSCASGLVSVTGLVKTSSKTGWSKTIATLPAGCRPARNLIFSVNMHAAQARINVYTNGEIKWGAGGAWEIGRAHV